MTTDSPTLLPHLTLTDADGRAVPDARLLSPGLTVLYFLRSASCPACLGHARRLAAAKDDGRLGADVVLVTPGGAAEAASVRSAVARRSSSGRLPQGVSVVASGDAHARVGLDTTLMLQHSGTLLVDDQRRVRYARTATIPTGSYREDDLLEALKSAQDAT